MQRENFQLLTTRQIHGNRDKEDSKRRLLMVIYHDVEKQQHIWSLGVWRSPLARHVGKALDDDDDNNDADNTM